MLRVSIPLEVYVSLLSLYLMTEELLTEISLAYFILALT